MRKTNTLKMVKGRRMRVTRLDGCGRFVYGDDSTAVTKGFVTVGFTANTTETDEITVTNASGETCLYEAGEAQLAGYSLEFNFCDVDPELFSMMTGMPIVYDAFGRVNGLDIDTKVKLDDAGFALELWTGTPAGNACKPGSVTQGNFGYLLLPYLQGGILGDFEVGNAAITFTLTGASTRNGGSWGRGPYNVEVNAGPNGAPDFAGPLTSPISDSVALRMINVQVAPPEALDGARPLLEDVTNGVGLTSVTATRTGNSVAISVLPDAGADEKVWYEFGDFTWDAVLGDGGDTTHVYDGPGTYTIWAYNGAGKPVTTTVTIP